MAEGMNQPGNMSGSSMSSGGGSYDGQMNTGPMSMGSGPNVQRIGSMGSAGMVNSPMGSSSVGVMPAAGGPGISHGMAMPQGDMIDRPGVTAGGQGLGGHGMPRNYMGGQPMGFGGQMMGTSMDGVPMGQHGMTVSQGGVGPMMSGPQMNAQNMGAGGQMSGGVGHMGGRGIGGGIMAPGQGGPMGVIGAPMGSQGMGGGMMLGPGGPMGSQQMMNPMMGSVQSGPMPGQGMASGMMIGGQGGPIPGGPGTIMGPTGQAGSVCGLPSSMTGGGAGAGPSLPGGGGSMVGQGMSGGAPVNNPNVGGAGMMGMHGMQSGSQSMTAPVPHPGMTSDSTLHVGGSGTIRGPTGSVHEMESMPFQQGPGGGPVMTDGSLADSRPMVAAGAAKNIQVGAPNMLGGVGLGPVPPGGGTIAEGILNPGPMVGPLPGQPLPGDGARLAPMTPAQLQMLKAQIMAYKYIARNQPVPDYVRKVLEGKRQFGPGFSGNNFDFFASPLCLLSVLHV